MHEEPQLAPPRPIGRGVASSPAAGPRRSPSEAARPGDGPGRPVLGRPTRSLRGVGPPAAPRADARRTLGYPAPVDEVLLAERLIAYDTSRRAGIGLATDFVAGWLEARGARVERLTPIGGRRCLIARVGAGPARLILHGHLDVVPG